ncbi:MAG: SRPBCC family protein [Paludibacteraceae bacterium]|nr:SRPBCC family protein [Paludibacteraceae bacterium]
MADYQSTVKHIAAPAERVFAKFTDLTLLQPVIDKYKEQVPQEQVKIKDIELSKDSCFITVEPVGKIGLKIIEAEPYKTVKFASESSPLDFNFWIQLVEKEPGDTKLRLTLRADIPFMIKAMIGSKLEQGIEMMAEALTKIEY